LLVPDLFGINSNPTLPGGLKAAILNGESMENKVIPFRRSAVPTSYTDRNVSVDLHSYEQSGPFEQVPFDLRPLFDEVDIAENTESY
jgi:hypothetical protein